MSITSLTIGKVAVEESEDSSEDDEDDSLEDGKDESLELSLMDVVPEFEEVDELEFSLVPSSELEKELPPDELPLLEGDEPSGLEGRVEEVLVEHEDPIVNTVKNKTDKYKLRCLRWNMLISP